MNIYEKLGAIQVKLKAPKSQFNKFGNFYYRNCEDILEAVKPLCAEIKAVITVCDELVMIGTRYYVKATATLHDAEELGSCVSNMAYAREEETKKGMDGSQVTGASSSYARKYALNGLLCIDDTKDADSDNKDAGKADKPKNTKPSASALEAKLKYIERVCADHKLSFDALLKANNLTRESCDENTATKLIISLNKKYGEEHGADRKD